MLLSDGCQPCVSLPLCQAEGKEKKERGSQITLGRGEEVPQTPLGLLESLHFVHCPCTQHTKMHWVREKYQDQPGWPTCL